MPDPSCRPTPESPQQTQGDGGSFLHAILGSGWWWVCLQDLEFRTIVSTSVPAQGDPVRALKS